MRVAEHVRPGRSAELAHQFAPELVADVTTEREISVDQTNYSVVVADAVVVKWLLPPVAQPYGAVEQLAHLAEVGFAEMPAFIAAYTHDGAVVAMLNRFLPGALDGWDWYVDELTAALDAGDPDVPIQSATRLGLLAGRLAVAFATASSVAPTPVEIDSIAFEAERGLDLLAEALASTDGPPHDRLAERAERVKSTINALSTAPPVHTQWVHGDLHVGQVIRAGDTMLVIDFDGSPVAEPALRHARRSAMVDLASMLQSIDHVGRIVAKRRPDLNSAVDAFLAVAIPAAQSAYETKRPISHTEQNVLNGLRAIQELHEFVYAARSLPHWLYVPDAALQSMFPKE